MKHLETLWTLLIPAAVLLVGLAVVGVWRMVE